MAATLIVAALLIATLLVIAAISAAAALATTAATLIVALILVPTMSVMMSAMTTAAAATLPEPTLAAAGTEGALMALIALGSTLLGISLVTGAVATGRAVFARIGGRIRRWRRRSLVGLLGPGC